MKALRAPLEESQTLEKARALLQPRAGCVTLEGLAESQKLHLADAFREVSTFRLFLTYTDRRAALLAEEARFYDKNTAFFPTKDLIFYQADLRGREIETKRLTCLRALLEGKPLTIVTTFAALLTPQLPLPYLKESIWTLAKGDRIDTAKAAERLLSMGYERSHQVEQPGQFSVRGDIIDVFDLTADDPVRIELWGDEIDQIRQFDPESQRSTLRVGGVTLYPATELLLSGVRLSDGLSRMEEEAARTVEALKKDGKEEAAGRLGEEIASIREEALQWGRFERLEGFLPYFYPHTETLLDLFPADRTLVCLEEPARIEEQARAVALEFRENMMMRLEKGLILPGQMTFLQDPETVIHTLSGYRRLGLAELAAPNAMLPPEPVLSVHGRGVSPYNRQFSALVADLQKLRKEKYRILLFSASRTRARRLAQDLCEAGIDAFYGEDPDRLLSPGEVMTFYGGIRHGFAYPDLRFEVIAESDIFGAKSPRRKKVRKYEGESIRNFSDLSIGDYVVHETHGIGIYRGVEKIEVEHIAKEYIKVEYAGGGTLYVLPTEADVLQKYVSAGAGKPKVNKLGSQEWTTTRRKVERAVEDIAMDLVELYAARQHSAGHVFGPDTVWQNEFEELFPFAETEDQLKAIEETKRDMESPKIMDRLICGDVGYGKTEIAIRAAFKAVQDSCQVAVLVPTTILAQQHFNTFTERMKNYPVRIALLSRFRTAAEQKKTIRGLAEGSVDIVIGTHRLLSKDVQFKRLGLLVVDEEQRFGVSHKEKIKKLKEDVDVLTLTATPIPRTLHMSLIGIRDMSVLEEAPEDRVPIQTYVMEYNEELVREAILREISRGGQIYYVYNRVNDIQEVTAALMRLVPEARIAYAHGQMQEAQLERVMYDFINGEVDVLVSTTIIETGLDISNVNTMIVHDADQMGLSQLYQLRGRVGRSDRTAYAFLLYKRGRLLREEAQKRLLAIRDFTELGSGFRIAMRDLEIRGAGNLLGKAQHGHMQAIGYELYARLLETAVRKVTGEQLPEEKTATVNLSVDAFLPDTYILNEAQKLDVYKRISLIDSTEAQADVRAEMEDRFGEPPAPAQNLLRIALIRAIAAKLDVKEITGFFGGEGTGTGTIRFLVREDAGFHVENIPGLLSSYNGALSFYPKGEPAFVYTFRPSGLAAADEETLLSATEELLIRISEFLWER